MGSCWQAVMSPSACIGAVRRPRRPSRAQREVLHARPAPTTFGDDRIVAYIPRGYGLAHRRGTRLSVVTETGRPRPTHDLDLKGFRFGAIKPVTSDEFRKRWREAAFDFPEIRGHAEAFRILGSEIVALRRSARQPKDWIATVRFGRRMEAIFGFSQEVLLLYSLHHDLQRRDFERLPSLAENLPRATQDDIYLVSSRDLRAKRKLTEWSIREPFTAVAVAKPSADHVADAKSFVSQILTVRASRNLYSETLPVRGADFFGRQELLISLSQRLREGRVCGVFGMRKTGKTSLILELGRQFVKADTAHRLFILRDLETLPSDASTHSEVLLSDLTGALLVSFRQHNIRTHELSELSTSSTWSDFRRAVSASLGHASAAEHQIILALDEVESLLGLDPGKDPERSYLPEFFGVLRALVQENRNFNVLLSGITDSILTEGQLSGRENPLLAWATAYYLPPLRSDEASELIRAIGRRMALEWTPEAMAAMYDATGGHAFLLRSLCAFCVDQLPLDVEYRVIVLADVQASLRAWQRSVAQQIRQMYQSFERYYPDACILLLLVSQNLIESFEIETDYLDQSLVLERLGLIAEHDSEWAPTPLARLVAQP